MRKTRIIRALTDLEGLHGAYLASWQRPFGLLLWQRFRAMRSTTVARGIYGILVTSTAGQWTPA